MNYSILLLSLCVFLPLQSAILTTYQQWGVLPQAVQPALETPAPSSLLPKKEQILLSAAPAWSAALHAFMYKGLRAAHFELHADDVDGDKIAVTFYIATTEQKARNAYQCKVVMKQSMNGRIIQMFDAQGHEISGSVPYVQAPDEQKNVPVLPWRDGMSLWYSVIVQVVEGKVQLAVIQHTKDSVVAPPHMYTPVSVHDMLATYTTHHFLRDRAHGYLESLEHFRVLPLPYQHAVYAPLQSSDWCVSWSVEQGTVSIVPMRA